MWHVGGMQQVLLLHPEVWWLFQRKAPCGWLSSKLSWYLADIFSKVNRVSPKLREKLMPEMWAARQNRSPSTEVFNSKLCLGDMIPSLWFLHILFTACCLLPITTPFQPISQEIGWRKKEKSLIRKNGWKERKRKNRVYMNGQGLGQETLNSSDGSKAYRKLTFLVWAQNPSTESANSQD